MFSRTLIISPHCDDETIGCGGLMSSISKQGAHIRVVIVATHNNTFNYNVSRVVSNDERLKETAQALKVLGDNIKVFQLEGFEDGKLDTYNKKDMITQLDNHIKFFKPTAVLFPYSSHHQDHQVVYTASIAALRTTIDTNYIKLKCMYEYPYISSWSSNINLNSKLYYPLSYESIQKKKCALEQYKSQLIRDDRDILSVDSIITLAKSRGKEIGYNYAECFYPMSIIYGGN